MIRTWLKKIFESFPDKDEEEILRIVEPYASVSFDAFDTLVKRRTFSPEDIFINVAEKYNLICENRVLDPEQFKRDRLLAAQEARKEINGEINIDNIYEKLRKKYNNSEKLKKLEIDEEIASCFPNEPIKRIFDACIAKGKEVFIISDMYLSKETITEILAECGIFGYTDLLVSSDIGCTKKNLGLFKYYLTKFQKEACECVHIGDNLVSDYISAKKIGIKAVRIATYPCRSFFCRDNRLDEEYKRTYQELQRFINNATDPKWSTYKKFGFECIGPMLYYFSIWLRKETQTQGIEKIFFLSRDGFLIKKIYNELYGNENTDYLNISRRAVHVPLFHIIETIEEYLSINGQNKRWSLITVCNRLGIDIKEGEKIWIEAGLKEDYTFKVKDISGSQQLKTFFELTHDRAFVESKKEYSLCESYLKDKHFEGNIAIVDTGGNGTTQYCLEKLCRGKTYISGFYLWSYNPPDGRFKVYPCNEYDLVGGETVVCELPLTSEEGTTIRYIQMVNGKVVPELDLYEFKNEHNTQMIINEIQEGAVSFASVMKDGKHDIVPPEVAYHNAMMATRYPRNREVELFGDLCFHSDNEDTYLAKPRNLFYYVINPKHLLKDFKLVRWKIGFLKRLFRLPLSYFDLLKWMKRYS